MIPPYEAQPDPLLCACTDALKAGSRILHLFPGTGGARLALWDVAQGRIREVEVGPGPYLRPSRNGLPSLRFAEEGEFSMDAFAEDAPQPAVRGEGMHVVPLGPVRADAAEALRYEMDVLGDEIHGLALRPGYKRRGAARRMQGADPAAAIEVAERVTGTSTVAHGLAFSLAVEDALGLYASERTALLRSTLAELERLHSHLGDLAALAAATGTVVAAADLYRAREAVLQFAGRWTGHRYLRGLVAPGGWRSELSDAGPAFGALLDEVERAFLAVRRALEHTNSFLDRLHGAGRIPPEEPLQLVGVAGRGAGRAEDVRFDRPYGWYHELCAGKGPAGCPAGDAYGRYVVRCEEISDSLAMLRRGGGAGAAACTPSEWSGDGTGHGLVEAPRGRLYYRVALAAGRIESVRIRTASSINWVAVPGAVANGNILQDFPIIDASFGLAVAALDL